MGRKVLALRRNDACSVCQRTLDAGTRAVWDSAARAVTCLECVGIESGRSNPGPTEFDVEAGTAGASARREYERRHALQERSIEARWGTGRLGRVAKRLSSEPSTTKAWSQGARGEERIAAVLAKGLGEAAVVLHDRRVPGTRGNIDHLVIAASGVWVVDAKRYTGKVERRDVGGFFRHDVRLFVGGRDRTKVVANMGWQVDAVRVALDGATVPVHSAVTFVGAEWSLLSRPFEIGGTWVTSPRKLVDLIAVPGTLDQGGRDQVARRLAELLPAK